MSTTHSHGIELSIRIEMVVVGTVSCDAVSETEEEVESPSEEESSEDEAGMILLGKSVGNDA